MTRYRIEASVMWYDMDWFVQSTLYSCFVRLNGQTSPYRQPISDKKNRQRELGFGAPLSTFKRRFEHLLSKEWSGVVSTALHCNSGCRFVTSFIAMTTEILSRTTRPVVPETPPVTHTQTPLFVGHSNSKPWHNLQSLLSGYQIPA